ncbi:hypothetical protein D6D15_02881 [Aureobasidium pullulans]|uniref:Uncharacterized protein n=1 Tax=Aureobasidium pullulans TaxID=5580 RepID=A0A4V4IWD7_AURPU|nr:hypothetical protein D6D15_02881 [Aureobasidium pullulans]
MLLGPALLLYFRRKLSKDTRPRCKPPRTIWHFLCRCIKLISFVVSQCHLLRPTAQTLAQHAPKLLPLVAIPLPYTPREAEPVQQRGGHGKADHSLVDMSNLTVFSPRDSPLLIRLILSTRKASCRSLSIVVADIVFSHFSNSIVVGGSFDVFSSAVKSSSRPFMSWVVGSLGFLLERLVLAGVIFN